MNEIEEWKAIPGYVGYYEASTLGRIRSVDRKIPNKVGVIGKRRYLNLKGKLMKLCIAFIGDLPRYIVVLQKQRKSKCVEVDNVIASTFIPKPEHKVKVAHKNGKKLDCRVENLYWEVYPKPKPEKVPKEKKIIYRVIDTETTKKYTSVEAASKDTGISVRRITKSIKNPEEYNRFRRIQPDPPHRNMLDPDTEFMLSLIRR